MLPAGTRIRVIATRIDPCSLLTISPCLLTKSRSCLMESSLVSHRDPLRDLQTWVVDHPEADHSVDALAARVAMSPRHFARVFRDEVGQSPGRFVECVRVEAARRRLEESRRPVEEIASIVGFGTSETMRRAFLRQIGVGPSAYRDRFAKSTVALSA